MRRRRDDRDGIAGGLDGFLHSIGRVVVVYDCIDDGDGALDFQIRKMLVRWRCFALSCAAIVDVSSSGRSCESLGRIWLVPRMVSGATLLFEMLFNGARSFELRGEIFRWLVPRAPPTCLRSLLEIGLTSASDPHVERPTR